MLFTHRTHRPTIDPTASVAATAILSGDVTIGPGTRIAHGAILTSQGGPLRIGHRCIVMENAVLRATRHHPLTLGHHVLVGPRAYLSGCTVDDDVFLATGTTVFNGAHIGSRSEVRVNGVVHILTDLAPDSLVPIAWIAVGRPAAILPPGAHQEIWARQQPLDFPKTVFGVDRRRTGKSIMPELCARYSRWLAHHDDDRPVGCE